MVFRCFFLWSTSRLGNCLDRCCHLSSWACTVTCHRNSVLIGRIWLVLAFVPRFDFMLVPRGMKSAVFAGFHSCCPRGTLTPFHAILERFLTPSGCGLKVRLDAVVLTSFLLQRVNCCQLSSSRLVDMADDPADNAVFYNCVPTCNHLDSEPNIFRNKIFP